MTVSVPFRGLIRFNSNVYLDNQTPPVVSVPFRGLIRFNAVRCGPRPLWLCAPVRGAKSPPAAGLRWHLRANAFLSPQHGETGANRPVSLFLCRAAQNY